MIRKAILSVLVLAITGVSARAGVPQWRFRVGDEFYIDESAQVRVVVEGDGVSDSQEILANLVTRVRVVEQRPDGSVVLEHRIDSCRAGAPGQLEADPFVEGAVFRLTFDPAMNVVSFEGYDDLVRRIAGDDAQVEAQIRQAISAEEMQRRLSEYYTLYLPDGPNNTGSCWTRGRHVTLLQLGSADMLLRFTPAGEIPAKQGTVQVLAFLVTADIHSSGPHAAITSKLQMRDAGGNVLFDKDAGRLVSMTICLPLEGTLVLDDEGNQVELDAKMQIDQTIRVLPHYPNQVASDN